MYPASLRPLHAQPTLISDGAFRFVTGSDKAGISGYLGERTSGIDAARTDVIKSIESGTLDEDTPNPALETLQDLTNDMQSVGLISHTEQVKSMITWGGVMSGLPRRAPTFALVSTRPNPQGGRMPYSTNWKVRYAWTKAPPIKGKTPISIVATTTATSSTNPPMD